MRRRKDTRETFAKEIPKERIWLYIPCHDKERAIIEAARRNKTTSKFMVDAMYYYIANFRQGRELDEGPECKTS